MSTELTTTTNVSAALFDKLVLKQDLSTLSEVELVQYYTAVCHNVGIDPTTKPFDIVTLNGKKQLYPNKTCTAQLTAKHKPSVTILSKEKAGDVYIVTARVTKQGGSMVEDTGVVPFPLQGAESQANAIMKATTKAKRRAILSAFGLGMLDESEVEDIRGAEVQPFELMDTTPSVILDTVALLDGATTIEELQAVTDGIKKLSVEMRGDKMLKQAHQDAALRIGCKWIGGKWVMPEVVA